MNLQRWLPRNIATNYLKNYTAFMQAIEQGGRQMTVTFPLELEQQVKTQAAQKGMDVLSYLLSLVQRDINAADPAGVGGNASDDDPDALNRMIAKMTSRTPEEKMAARRRAIQESRPQIELAPDVSPFDVMPVIRGNETDEEVIAALKELS